MQVISIEGKNISDSDVIPQHIGESGYLWLSFSRREFEVMQPEIHDLLQNLCGAQLFDLHVADLLNNQLPSHYDYTNEYDLLVFRRLARGRTESDVANPGQILHRASSKGGPPILRRIDTSPIGFLVLDRVVISVHPADCNVRDTFANRLLHSGSNHTASRVPANPADLMLRMIGVMVDGYLDLRRELTRQLDHWQSELINPRTRFNNWSALLDSRLTLHYLDEVCEDQRSAIQDWIDALEDWHEDASLSAKELEMLQVRSRDVLEHIERVVHHVSRLEQSAETAVQMHFNVQSNRNNDVMKTLTALTAIFLPLNLITGFFGMNFEHFPFLKSDIGLALTEGFMVFLTLGLVSYFWLNNYLSSTGSAKNEEH
jgi:Mg2+ and Co2+ transporter CorA